MPEAYSWRPGLEVERRQVEVVGALVVQSAALV